MTKRIEMNIDDVNGGAFAYRRDGDWFVLAINIEKFAAAFPDLSHPGSVVTFALYQTAAQWTGEACRTPDDLAATTSYIIELVERGIRMNYLKHADGARRPHGVGHVPGKHRGNR